MKDCEEKELDVWYRCNGIFQEIRTKGKTSRIVKWIPLVYAVERYAYK